VGHGVDWGAREDGWGYGRPEDGDRGEDEGASPPSRGTVVIAGASVQPALAHRVGHRQEMEGNQSV
jgi:hypothetical protein